MLLWLLTGFGAIRSAFSRAWLWITASSTHLLIAALAIALALGFWERRGWNASEVRLKACEMGRKADRASYVAAQQGALRRAVAAKEAQEAHYKELADETDRKAAVAAVDANARVAEYVRTHRVPARPSGPSSGPARGPESGSPQSGDGPGDAPLLVTVTPDDIQVCTQNTVRLEAVRDWALTLGK